MTKNFLISNWWIGFIPVPYHPPFDISGRHRHHSALFAPLPERHARREPGSRHLLLRTSALLDAVERVAFLDHIIFLESHCLEKSLDPRLNLNAVDGLDASDE